MMNAHSSAMDSQYHHFGSSDETSVHAQHSLTPQTGMRRIMVYCLYGMLVLLLFILVMVTGVQFTKLNKEIINVKIHLERLSQFSVLSKSDVPPKDVYLKEQIPVRGSCKEGWVSFQSNCYLLSTNVVTWSKAEELCQTDGGHLVVLNNVEELDYLSQISVIRYDYWIGLVEREHEGHWSWVDGTDFSSTQRFWDEGQPDDWDYRENGEDCGQLHSTPKRKRRLWNDADCMMLYRYICEMKA